MTNQQHLITPPPELVTKWWNECTSTSNNLIGQLATLAARWGASQMTNQQHPIIPPSELVDQWRNSKILLKDALMVAAQWGADQELEACCVEVAWLESSEVAKRMRERRRPKPPSLKEQALEAWKECWGSGFFVQKDSFADTIRRALEALPE